MGAMRFRGHRLLAQSYYGLLVAESFERVVDRFFSNQFLAARHGRGFLRERRGAGGPDRLGGVEAARSPSVASVGVQVTRPSPRRPCVGVRGSLLAKVGWQRKSSVLLHWHRNPESPGALTKFDTPLLILVLVVVVVVLLHGDVGGLAVRSIEELESTIIEENHELSARQFCRARWCVGTHSQYSSVLGCRRTTRGCC